MVNVVFIEHRIKSALRIIHKFEHSLGYAVAEKYYFHNLLLARYAEHGEIYHARFKFAVIQNFKPNF